MAKARKSKTKKPAKKKTKKPASRAAAKSKRSAAKVKKVKKAKRTAKKPAPAKAKKAAPKAASKKKKPIIGEGNYAAGRAFDKDQTNFVKRNKARIPELGKQAEQALDGPEGDSLRAAEQEAMNRSTID